MQIYAEAERNASLLAIAEAQPYKWRDSGKYTQKPSAMRACLQSPAVTNRGGSVAGRLFLLGYRKNWGEVII